MSYEQLAYLHLATVVPAFAIGTWLLVRRKGTPSHRALGRVYLLLMGVTALVSLCMPARVVPCAYLAARRGNIREHRSNMVGLYLGGGLLVAGAFAFFPGRLLHVSIPANNSTVHLKTGLDLQIGNCEPRTSLTSGKTSNGKVGLQALFFGFERTLCRGAISRMA